MTHATHIGDDRIDTTSEESGPTTLGDLVSRLSRRGFLQGSAVAGLGLAGLAGTPTTVAGQRRRSRTDIEELLNDALTIARFQEALYDEAVGSRGAFTESDVERSDVAANFASNSLRYSVFNHFVDMGNHQSFHVRQLERALDDFRVDDTAPTRFSFPSDIFDDTKSFVDFARVVEDVGVAGYAGIAPELANAELDFVGGDLRDLEATPLALGIHSVEARHAGYLRTLAERRPWDSGDDGAVDEAIDPSDIGRSVRPYVDR